MVDDFAAIRRDDALVDGLGAARPTVPAGDTLARMLRGWRDAVDSEPFAVFAVPAERLRKGA